MNKNDLDLKAAADERQVNAKGLDPQLMMATRLYSLFDRIMDEVDQLPSLVVMHETTVGGERPVVHPLVGAAITAAKKAQEALKACGLNIDAKRTKDAAAEEGILFDLYRDYYGQADDPPQ